MAVLSDFRYPGGTSASIAEEITAQHAAGLRTVLVHVPAPHLRTVSEFNPRIVDVLRDGQADLALPGDDVSADLLVIRHPRVLEEDPSPVPRVTADHVVMVVNQPPRDRGRTAAYYDVHDVRARVERLFGPAEWAPIGPLVRESIRREDPTFELTPEDWVNVIDVDAWEVPRTTPSDPIVIGRFSRPDARKWPDTAAEILAAYPEADDIRVRVLGGGELATDRLGRIPANWEVHPFGSVPPQDFVRGIDLFVYFHSPSLVEAFGRTILEAMASGVPAILPRSFEPLFRDAAVYTTPDGVAGVVRELARDHEAYRDRSQRATAFVREHFGHAAHVRRVLDRMADREPSAPSAPTPRGDRTAVRSPADSPRTVLMLSSNGAGLGHVTRLMAIGRRLPSHVRAVVATQSQAAPIVQDQGFLTEYVPSRGHLDVPADKWNRLLRQRLDHLVACHRPQLVLVDATVPYGGLLQAMADHPEVRFVWLRRAMWKPGLGTEWIRRGRAYDAVIEPGDYAEDIDVGVTVPERPGAHRVDPITFLDANELTDRAEARQALELPAEGVIALLQLGAGNINDIQSPVGRVARRLLAAGTHVVVAQSPIAARALDVPEGVQVISYYPLSRHLRAFDLTISAGGYNSFHEAVSFAVPTVFVPNHDTALDDQDARVAEAVRRGLGLAIDDLDDPDAALDAILDPQVRADLARQCRLEHRPNGAAAAAAHLVDLLEATSVSSR